jgi:hypothetical protein
MARFVDDGIAFAKDPLKIMEDLKQTYIIKGVGASRYYLEGDVLELDGQWNRQGLECAFSCKHLYQTSDSQTGSVIESGTIWQKSYSF